MPIFRLKVWASGSPHLAPYVRPVPRRSPSKLPRAGSKRYREPRANDLCQRSWLRFLDSIKQENKGEPLRINGQLLSDTQRRALHRWEVEGCSPSVFTADRFLIALDLHLDSYFIYCASHGLTAWARGHAPSWHDEEAWLEVRWSCDRPMLRP